MSARFVLIDHETPMLLPPDLRDWVPANHLVHFVMDAVKLLDLGSAQNALSVPLFLRQVKPRNRNGLEQKVAKITK